MNKPKKLAYNLFSIILVLTLFAPITAGAGDYEVDEVQGEEVLVKVEQEKRGFFTGVGPMLGYEMAALNQFTGGVASQFGYRFNDMHSALLQGDFLYTRDRGVNYFFFPILPTYKITFDTNFFLYLGAGYTYLWAGRGTKFNSNTSTASKSYNGWSIYGGGGYDVWLKEKFMISPQVGVDYTRIASSNIILPLVRLNCNWLF